VVWERVTRATDIKNQTELADIVGVKQGAVSSRKKNDIWPEEWAYRIGRRYNLLTEWILTGEGPKNIDEIKKDDFSFPILSEINQWLRELVATEPYRKDWAVAVLQDALPLFKEWKQSKEQSENTDYSGSSKKIA
jgi:hypothetical protein